MARVHVQDVHTVLTVHVVVRHIGGGRIDVFTVVVDDVRLAQVGNDSARHINVSFHSKGGTTFQLISTINLGQFGGTKNDRDICKTTFFVGVNAVMVVNKQIRFVF